MQTSQCVRMPSVMVAQQCAPAHGRVVRLPARSAARPARTFNAVVRAAGEVAVSSSTSSQAETSDNFIPVIRPEDLPKGARKEVSVAGTRVLLFWYRNQIYAIEARSPAEGAYSEGFSTAKFTQDYCIECPSTGTLFSFQDGSIVSWYPTNPVLRMLTPQSTCRNLEIYPVKLTQDAIMVDLSNVGGFGARSTKGGSNTSLENNNVYGLEPRMYADAPSEQAGGFDAASGATALVLAMAVGLVAVAGTATFIYVFGGQ